MAGYWPNSFFVCLWTETEFIMHQSIPAVPITLSVLEIGHSKFYERPGAGHLCTPGQPPGI